MRDFAEVRAEGYIDGKVALDGLDLLEVDPLGLDTVDKKVIRTIIEKFDGGPVGLETIAATINESADTVEDVYEPYLMQLGFLNRTLRGRMATPAAYRYLGYTPPKTALVQEEEEQGNLFGEE